jgi:hypothetical protein
MTALILASMVQETFFQFFAIIVISTIMICKGGDMRKY